MPNCRIVRGDICKVQHSDTPVTLVLTNAIQDSKIEDVTITPENGGNANQGTIAQDGKSVQIAIANAGDFVVVAKLNKVAPVDATRSVSLNESCDGNPLICIIDDPVSKRGQFELEVQ